ncbi:hypothetical protein MA9V1_204 [Chryseobacterium phage MA9V-1]|nr:hypothetical protein MA9V1_204 [Chryseobacterium phage MA9V-1]
MEATNNIAFDYNYVSTLLTPYYDKPGKLTMPASDTTGLQLGINQGGHTKFFVHDNKISFIHNGTNYAAVQDFEYMLNKTTQNLLKISCLDYNKLDPEKFKGIHSGYNALRDGLLEYFSIQLCAIYFDDIKSMEVSQEGFVVNDVQFKLSKK